MSSRGTARTEWNAPPTVIPSEGSICAMRSTQSSTVPSLKRRCTPSTGFPNPLDR